MNSSALCVVFVGMLISVGGKAQVFEPCPKKIDHQQVLLPTASEADLASSNNEESMPQDGKTVILLFSLGGQEPSNKATVIFQSPDGKQSFADRDASDPYRFTVKLSSARYRLEAFDPVLGLRAPARYVDLPSPAQIRIGLGRPKAPFFRSQDSIVPFEPSTDLIGLVFEFNALGKEKAQGILDLLTSKLPVVPVWDPIRKLGPIRGEGEAIVVRLDPSTTHDVRREEVISQIRKLVPVGTRVGTPVDVGQGVFRMIDNQFVVRLTDPDRLWILDKLDIVVLRRLGQSPDLLHVALPGENYEENLATMECLVTRGVLDVAEPDLVFETIDHAVPVPNDPRYAPEQSPFNTTFGRQRFWRGWALLQEEYEYSRIGDGDIYVTILERNIAKPGPEFYCADSHGTSQVALCWDATTGSVCSTVSPSEGEHGFGVLGIIAACVHNASEIAGMAPGVRKIVVRFGTYSSATGYSDLLRWVAKTPNGNPIPCPSVGATAQPCNWVPIVNPPDIITNSYGMCSALTPSHCVGSWWFLPSPIGTTFSELVGHGRQKGWKKLGIVLVYSAGNSSQPNLYKSPFARDWRTLGISNCMIDGPDEHLVRYANEWMYGGAGSDSGNEIDICALGHLTPTVQFSGCFTTSAGKCVFSGTSAAAPEVSAAASLVLSADPMLSWVGVKKILRKTADKIDLLEGGWSNGRSPLYGSGRLNACEAIRSALVGKGLAVPIDACN